MQKLYNEPINNLGCDCIMSEENKNNKSKKSDKTTAEVKVLGESLVVSGKSSIEYIKTVAEYVNNRLEELSRSYPRMNRNKIVTLGAMNLADDLIKSRQEIDLLKANIDETEREKKKMKQELEEAREMARYYKEENEELTLLLEEVD